MKKCILSVCLALCMALTLASLPAQAAKTAFSDVSDATYYADSVAWAVSKDITHGTTATTFSPNNTCTIAQITTFLWRACGSPEAGVSENPFSDLSESHYSYQAALWAYENGITLSKITDGVIDANRFAGNGNCLRYVVALFMWILNGRPETPSHPFNDVPPNTAIAEAVSWAVEKGITKGTSATTFSPNDTCTRAQIVTFLYRANQAGVLSAAQEYTVTLNANGGKVTTSPKSDYVSPGQTVTVTVAKGTTYEALAYLVAVRDGYDFLGWYTEKEGGTEVTASTKVTKSDPHMLYAHWVPNNGAYNITLDANGGKFDFSDVMHDKSKVYSTVVYEVTQGENYPDLSNRFLVRDGYDFLGWYTEKEGGTEVTTSTKVTKSSPHTLYAHWGYDT